jgi:hypothetical protein
MATALLEPRIAAANALPAHEVSARLVRFMRIVDTLPRLQIEAVVEALIASLDTRDGDFDLEDSEASETAISRCGRMLHVRSLADHAPGYDQGESECAWQEWDQRDLEKRRDTHEPVGSNIAWGSEDDEVDGEDVCQAGDDGCAPFMTHFGPRWGSDAYEVGMSAGISA